jgi:hypothetical protein
MTSFELDILDEKSRAGAEFLARIVEEMQRALVTEKTVRKITQQAIAEKIGTSRHVINRELQGLENVTARRIGEFFWAIGWEPRFEAVRPPSLQNCDFLTPRMQTSAPVPPEKKGTVSGADDPAISSFLYKIIRKNDAPVPAF